MFWLVLVATLATAAAQGNLFEWNFFIPDAEKPFNTPGLKLGFTVVRTMPFVRYPTTCARLCMLEQRCRSFNFNPRSKICELSSGEHVNNLGNFMAVEGWEYFFIEWFTIDKSGLGPCGSKTCPEDATCLELCDRDGFHFAECICLDNMKHKTSCANRDKGKWSEWGEWGSCSKTCSLGLRSRERNCTHPHIPGLVVSADNCDEIDTDIAVCDMGDCPSWKVWSDWSVCTAHKKCGRGTKLRTRECNGGTPNVDDLCTGPIREEDSCYAQSCNAPIRLAGSDTFGEGRVEIYNNVEEAWGGICADGWSMEAAKIACKQAIASDKAIEATFGTTFGNVLYPLMLRNVRCKGEEGTIQNCTHDGWRPEDTRCTEGAAGVMCVVDGIWSEWSAWSECSESCDWGFQERTRECNFPAPLNGGKDCAGMPRQRKKCYQIICPTDGVWMSWSSWGECSLTCGSGLRYRNRTCDGPYNGGKPCPTDPVGEININDCHTQRCPFRNCHEYKIVDQTNLTGVYLVDPDGPGDLAAYDVFCDMDDPDEGISILNHSQVERFRVQGYEARAEYEVDLHYDNATLKQAIALVDSSLKCKQFLKWECKSASIHEPVHTYEENKTLTLTFATSRRHEQLDFFPGGEAGTESCACWRNQTCRDPHRWCNCDANLDDEVLEDSGFVQDKELLPLTAFFAGDTGATWEEGWHTIGPVICKGTQRSLHPGQTHPMNSIRPTNPPVFGPN